jgi:multidrug resistance efflux pump
MNKQFITKNFLLIVMLLAVAFAFAMKATIFQRPATLPATAVATPPGSTTAITSSTAIKP